MRYRLLYCLMVFIPLSGSAQLITTPDLLPQHAMMWAFEKIAVTWKGSGEIQMHLNEGLNNLEEGKFDLAYQHFSEVIRKDNQSFQAYYYRGVALKMMARLPEAATDFEKALSLNTNLAEGWMELGKVRQMQSFFSNAEACYEKAGKASYLRLVDGLFLTGSLYMEMNNLTAAERKFKECLEKNPDYHNAQINLALIEASQKRNPKVALPYLENIIQKDSANRYALQLQAAITLVENPQQSLKNLNTLIRHYPDNLSYHYMRGLLYAGQQQYDKAFLDFQKILRATEVDENRFRGQQTPLDKRIDIQYAGYYLLSTMYGFPEEGISKLKKAYCQFLTGQFEEGNGTIRTIPDYQTNPLTLFLLGLGHEHSDNHEEAWDFYEAALKLDNDIQDAHTKVGIYNTNIENWKEAERHFSEALRINPKLHAVYKLRGVTRYFLEKYPQAIADFSKYLEYDSLDNETLKNRAFAYRMAGKVTEALHDYLRVNPARFNFVEYQSFIKVLLEQNDTLHALQYLKKFHDIKPEDEYAIGAYVELLVQTKKDNEAKEIITGMIKSGKLTHVAVESSLYTSLAVIYARENKIKEAEETLTRALKIYDHARTYRERGLLYLRQNEQVKALQDLKKAAELGDQEAQNMLKKR